MRRSLPCLVLPFLVSLFAGAVGCAAPTTDALDARSDAVSLPLPSQACGAVATKAVLALEAINESGRTTGRLELVASHSDREVVRVQVGQGARRDRYLVSTESMGGSPCLAYGLQVASDAIDLVDDDALLTALPSTECRDVAVRAVHELSTLNGQDVAITGVELAAAHSDHELLRVRVAGSGGAKDSWLVNTESMGGSPCLVYGLQLRSQEGVSTVDDR